MVTINNSVIRNEPLTRTLNKEVKKMTKKIQGVKIELDSLKHRLM